jgi:hypothetical protein
LELLWWKCTTWIKSIVAKQEATAEQQQKQIEALAAGLQKVTDQLAAASPSGSGLELRKFAAGHPPWRTFAAHGSQQSVKPMA